MRRGGPPRRRDPLPPHLDLRGLRRPPPRLRRGLHRGDPVPAPHPLQRLEGGRRPRRAGLRRDLRAAGDHHQLLQQLRALPVPREGHPAVHRQGPRRPAPAALRVDPEPAGVAARRRPLPGHRGGPRARAGRRDLPRRQRRRGEHRGDRRRRARRPRQAAIAQGDRPRPARPRPPLPPRLHEDPHASSAGSRPCRFDRGPGRDRRAGTRPTASWWEPLIDRAPVVEASWRRARLRARRRDREPSRCGSSSPAATASSGRDLVDVLAGSACPMAAPASRVDRRAPGILPSVAEGTFEVARRPTSTPSTSSTATAVRAVDRGLPARRRDPRRGLDGGRRLRVRPGPGLRRQRARDPPHRRGGPCASGRTSSTSRPTTSSTARSTGPTSNGTHPIRRRCTGAASSAASSRSTGGRPSATVVRTSWVCGAHGANMVKTVLRLAAADPRPAALRRRPARVPDLHRRPGPGAGPSWPPIAARACSTSPTRA